MKNISVGNIVKTNDREGSWRILFITSLGVCTLKNEETKEFLLRELKKINLK